MKNFARSQKDWRRLHDFRKNWSWPYLERKLQGISANGVAMVKGWKLGFQLWGCTWQAFTQGCSGALHGALKKKEKAWTFMYVCELHDRKGCLLIGAGSPPCFVGRGSSAVIYKNNITHPHPDGQAHVAASNLKTSSGAHTFDLEAFPASAPWSQHRDSGRHGTFPSPGFNPLTGRRSLSNLGRPRQQPCSYLYYQTFPNPNMAAARL